MIDFRTPGDFAKYLAKVTAEIPRAQSRGLASSAEMMLQEARQEIGFYQDAQGPFPEWPELADSTLHGFHDEHGHYHPGKIELGYATEGDHRPLERTGDLRDSIMSAHDMNSAGVGSDSDVAVEQELGTRRMPARSFLGRAVYVTAEAGLHAILQKVCEAIIGKSLGAMFPKHISASDNVPF